MVVPSLAEKARVLLYQLDPEFKALNPERRLETMMGDE
jgi:hypothetical protein